MSFTSAHSGDNYRNWWPHPVMTGFTNYSIDLLDKISALTGDRINMNRNGYLLVTRNDNIEHLLEQLQFGYGVSAETEIRIHEGAGDSYKASLQLPTAGVDVINRHIIDVAWPQLDQKISRVLHIRRAGDIDGQQLGQHMLEQARERGTRLVRGEVIQIDRAPGYTVSLDNGRQIRSEQLLVAAGPFVNEVLKYLGEALPVTNVLQQKLAFEDVAGTVPRTQPFTVELDAMPLDWTDEEREMLASEENFNWLAGEMPGGVHCRPEGGSRGTWVKLGWAFNSSVSDVSWNPPLDDLFPEIVLRGAARMIPALQRYYDRLPNRRSHYGGFYTMTEENWPIIGPLNTPGLFVIGALSGFGSMAACAAGSLCTSWITGAARPVFADHLAINRYQNRALMNELKTIGRSGSL
jgi:glycine/D-amino acid oxidase-like deaminating enzyme